MTFIDTPVLRVAGTGQWILENKLTYVTEAGEVIEVPKGFYTDLASIPRVFHWLIPVNGKHRAAAIVHDYLYTIKDRQRAEADAIFLEAMKESGVRWTQRKAMYMAVRLGGWAAWNT